MRKSGSARALRSLSLAAASTLAAGALSGCADFARAISVGDSAVNVESPTAPLALAASHATLAYPSFAQVPSVPKDVRAAAAFKTAVVDEAAKRRELDAWVAAHPRMNFDMDAYLARTRSRAFEPGAPPVQDDTGAAEALAARLRAEATPPPPVK